MPAERWLDSGNLVARVNLPNMRSPAERKLDVYGQAVRGLLELEPDRGRREKYLEFIDIYADLTENELRRYRRERPEEGRVVAGLIQRAREEGNAARSHRRRKGRSGTTASAPIRPAIARCRRKTQRGRLRTISRRGPKTCSTLKRLGDVFN